MGSVPEIKSMVNSTSLSRGKPEISSGKTSGNSLTMGMSLWTRVFHVRPHSMGGTRFLLLLLENHLKKKRFGVATYFCFILKGKNKKRKKKS